MPGELFHIVRSQRFNLQIGEISARCKPHVSNVVGLEADYRSAGRGFDGLQNFFDLGPRSIGFVAFGARKEDQPKHTNTHKRGDHAYDAASSFTHRAHQPRYPCALSSSPFRTAAPAAPRMVLCESTVNLQSKMLQGRKRPTTADMPCPRSRCRRGCGWS